MLVVVSVNMREFKSIATNDEPNTCTLQRGSSLIYSYLALACPKRSIINSNSNNVSQEEVSVNAQPMGVVGTY